MSEPEHTAARRSGRQSRTDKFVRAVDIASVSLVIVFALVAAMSADQKLPVWLLLPAFGAFIGLVYGCTNLLRFRRNDEYTVLLWNTGTDWVCAAVIVIGIFVPIALGIYYALSHTPKGHRPVSDMIDEAGMLVVFSAFFIGVQWRRLRGAA